MKSIGFKNFRRFANLDPLQLGNITFFVGGNNAGKSTVVKAMMLVLDNLSEIERFSMYTPEYILGKPNFRLDANRIHEVHIGTFGRALHKPYPEEKQIYFEAEIGNYRFAYYITGDTESKQANANVSKIEITNLSTSVRYTFDYINSEARLLYNELVLSEYTGMYMSNAEKIQIQRRLDDYQAQREQLLNELKSATDAVQIARLNNDLKTIERSVLALKKRSNPFEGIVADKEVEEIWSLDPSEAIDFYEILSDHAREVLKTESEEEGQDKASEQELFNVGLRRRVSTKKQALGSMLEKESRLLMRISHSDTIEYISAHAASQKVLFSIEDKNDYMASVIREFKQCRIEEGNKEDIFITSWMNKLGIGLYYSIEPIAGEAYTMDITNMQGETMPLADLGMGAIQMMLLLLRLTTIMRKRHSEFRSNNSVVIIVEEPEQNIHPKLQSLLTELFAEINAKYGFHFVIETHSEYIIRKSQAMVANGEVEFEKNPFKVFYFPESGKPYDMVYQENGRFKETFDSGFFDEAAKWTSEISAVELKNAPIQDFKWEEK